MIVELKTDAMPVNVDVCDCWELIEKAESFGVTPSLWRVSRAAWRSLRRDRAVSAASMATGAPPALLGLPYAVVPDGETTVGCLVLVCIEKLEGAAG